MRIHRVVVRGQFSDLTTDQKTALLDEADDHSIFKSSFTDWGTFTYEPNLVAFNFRYEVRCGPDDERDPAEIGLSKARASLEEWGLGYKRLRASAADMSEMWDA